jgi:ribonucleotide monophosphatase NagD (HAD superfamily)
LTRKKTVVVDIDGTLCSNTDGDYENAKPINKAIAAVNGLYSAGAIIVLFTARGTTTGIDWREITESQLASWGVNYHSLLFGKPFGHYYIDDKALGAEFLLQATQEIHKILD